MGWRERLAVPSWLLAGLLIGAGATPAGAEADFEQAPISYSKAAPQDRLAALQKRLDAGQVQLPFDAKFGYLPGVLKMLGISPSSQMLVFSKTSFQLRYIDPDTPRAVYFGDDAYVGWVQGGDVIELSSVDPELGTVFYTLEQRESPRPKFIRRTGECLQCHASGMTEQVPGQLVRSVYADEDGHPILRAGTFSIDHTSPLAQRWGGWYVTGKFAQEHLGNNIVPDPDNAALFKSAGGFPLDVLSKLVGDSKYLTPYSDVVALLVLEHQGRMHNLITRAGHATRLALRDQTTLNKMMGDPEEKMLPSTQRRIANAGEPLVKYMLFAEEAPLLGRVQGTSGYARHFAAQGPRDKRGRSLRDLDLESRLFTYPCSYLIYSDAFDSLPGPAAEFVYKRMWEVLNGQDTSETYSRLTPKDRQAILEILRATKKGLPEYWKG
ncbi:MAG: hypothetical protein OER86_13045 [Phycisphaerae bacterium]|nr:hypothetical protein [Phycisphaerae bacterium]